MSFKEKIIYLLNRRFKKESHDFASKILIVYDKIKENIDKLVDNSPEANIANSSQ